MSGNSRCEACLTRPSGIEGHEALDSSRTGPSTRLTFRCTRCGTRWGREYEGSGVFVWIELGQGEPRA